MSCPTPPSAVAVQRLVDRPSGAGDPPAGPEPGRRECIVGSRGGLLKERTFDDGYELCEVVGSCLFNPDSGAPRPQLCIDGGCRGAADGPLRRRAVRFPGRSWPTRIQEVTGARLGQSTDFTASPGVNSAHLGWSIPDNAWDADTNGVHKQKHARNYKRVHPDNSARPPHHWLQIPGEGRRRELVSVRGHQHGVFPRGTGSGARRGASVPG